MSDRYLTIYDIEPEVKRGFVDWIVNTNHNKFPILIFGTPNSRSIGTLFLLAHGTKEGKIIINNSISPLDETLKQLISSGLISNGVKHIFTICCYGGEQTSAVVDGIIIEPLHNSVAEIDISMDYTNNNMIIDTAPKNGLFRKFKHLWGSFLYGFIKKYNKQGGTENA